ncbi:hypothetical protein TRSA_15230 [Treponema saccharophilum]|nr:hypothetical protein TRSA_15230 [Treponema saccharophilum]
MTGLRLLVFIARVFFNTKKSRVDAFTCEPFRVPSLSSSEQACDGARACKPFSRSEIEFLGASVRRCAGGAHLPLRDCACCFFCARVFFNTKNPVSMLSLANLFRVLRLSPPEQACDGARACKPFSRSEFEFPGASVRRCAGARTYRYGIALVVFSVRAFFSTRKIPCRCFRLRTFFAF